jgi:hypothetical protein
MEAVSDVATSRRPGGSGRPSCARAGGCACCAATEGRSEATAAGLNTYFTGSKSFALLLGQKIEVWRGPYLVITGPPPLPLANEMVLYKSVVMRLALPTQPHPPNPRTCIYI